MAIHDLLATAAARTPNAVAIRDGSTDRSYAEFDAAVARMAARLAALASPGDRIAILSANRPEYAFAYFAASRAGLILVPWNTRLTAREHAAVAQDCDVKLVLHDEDFAPTAMALAPPALSLGAALEPTDRTPPSVRATPDTVAHLYYTSGTTGRPKGVPLTHGNVLAHVEMTEHELGIGPADVWGHIAPMFHLADAWATFTVTKVGGTHAFLPQFSAEAALESIANDRLTMTNLVPTMLQRMVASDLQVDTSSLRMILSGGAPIAPETVRAIVERFGCEYVQTYGMTETSPFLTMSLLDDDLRACSTEEQLRHRAKTGRPVRGIELRVVDAAGADVQPDEATVGEIRVRGATVTPGYWNQPEQTEATFVDGWLCTGDLAVVDGRGFVTIVDRKKDVILSGGETVYSTEVENRLFEHPNVIEAAVVGVPDPDLGERVVATVVTREPQSERDLLAFCRDGLAGFKSPKAIEFAATLPRTGSGKIDKRALRRQWQP